MTAEEPQPASENKTAAHGHSHAQTAIRVCLVAVTADYCGVGMMRTLLPFYAKQMAPDSGATLLGALETTYGIGQIIGATCLGRVSDTRGRKLVLLISFVGSAIGYGLTAVASTPTMLVLSRLPVGLAKQTVAAARAILADCVPRQKLSGMMSVLTSLFAVGYAIGPIIGGYLSETFGDAVPALATSSLFLALIPVTIFLLPETNPMVSSLPALCSVGGHEGKGLDSSETAAAAEVAAAGAANEKVPVKADRAAARRKIIGLILLLLLPEVAVIIYSSTGLSILVTSIGESRAFLGAVNSGTAAVMLTGGYVLFALASCILALLPSKMGVIYSLPIFAVALSICRSCPPTFLSKRTPATLQGEAMGLLDSGSSLCRVATPLLTGAVADYLGTSAPFWACAALACGGLLALSLASGGTEEEPETSMSTASTSPAAAASKKRD